MTDLNITVDVLLPLAVVAAIAWFVPKFLGQRLPQTLVGLWVNAGVSSIIMCLVCGIVMLAALGQASPAIWVYAVWLGLKFALLWVPVVILSLVIQPQHWELEE